MQTDLRNNNISESAHISASLFDTADSSQQLTARPCGLENSSGGIASKKEKKKKLLKQHRAMDAKLNEGW